MRSKQMLLMLVVGAAFCFALFWIPPVSGYEIPLRHPDQDEDLRTCSGCHEDNDDFPYRRFEHGLFFKEQHRHAAVGGRQVCQMCHRPSFCSDCHGAGVELKPSVKNHADPRRSAPHRGDYLVRHRIDGHMNPAKCFRCHGSPRTAASCRRCHG